MTSEPTSLHVVERADEIAAAALPPAAAAARRREPVTVELSVPVEAHGETRTSLTLRVPKIEDLEACDIMANRTTRTYSDFLVRLAGVPRSTVLQLDPADFVACCDAAAGFLLKRAPIS